MEQKQTVEGRIGYTYNLGNFENVRIDVGVTSDVFEGEDVKQAYDRIFGELEEQLGYRLEKAKKDLGVK